MNAALEIGSMYMIHNNVLTLLVDIHKYPCGLVRCQQCAGHAVLLWSVPGKETMTALECLDVFTKAKKVQ